MHWPSGTFIFPKMQDMSSDPTLQAVATLVLWYMQVSASCPQVLLTIHHGTCHLASQGSSLSCLPIDVKSVVIQPGSHAQADRIFRS